MSRNRALLLHGERKAFFLPTAVRPTWAGLKEGEFTAWAEERRRNAAVYATAEVDSRSETVTDFLGGSEARFERHVPLLPAAPGVGAFLGCLSWEAVVIGFTRSGPVMGWKMKKD